MTRIAPNWVVTVIVVISTARQCFCASPEKQPQKDSSTHSVDSKSKEFRIWKAADDRESIEARFLRIETTEAYFQRRDGSTAKAQLDSFCAADRDELLSTLKATTDRRASATKQGATPVSVRTLLLQEQVNSFPQAVGAMERILAKDAATINDADLQTMDNVLRFVVANLPSPLSTGSTEDGRWEWRRVCYQDCQGYLWCTWQWVWVRNPMKRKSTREMSILRQKLNDLTAAIVNIPTNPAISRGDFARQVYAVTLSADNSPPGLIIRE